MSHESLSRRSFLRNTAVGSTGSVLAAIPLAHGAVPGASPVPPAPPWPVTEASYPLSAPGKSIGQTRIKLASMSSDFPSTYARESCKPMLPTWKSSPAGARTSFVRKSRTPTSSSAVLAGRIFQPAKQLRWIQYDRRGRGRVPLPGFRGEPRGAHQHAAHVFAHHLGIRHRHADYPHPPPSRLRSA